MIDWCKDNPAIAGLIAFFGFIFLFQIYSDSHYRTSLPIEFRDDFSLEERQQIRKSIKWQLIAWQGDFGRPTRFAEVIVRRFFWQNRKGQRLSGSCRERTITIYAGQYMEAPSFYHELCHLNEDSTNEHKDPRWPKWESRNREICRFSLFNRKQESYAINGKECSSIK